MAMLLGTIKVWQGTQLPNAAGEHRGRFFLVQGDSENEDVLYICAKDLNGTYRWQEVYADDPLAVYGNFLDTTSQTCAAINTATAVKMNTTDAAVGIHRDTTNTSRIVADDAGIYNFQFSFQLTKPNSSVGYVYIWARRNGTDIPNSATKMSLSGSGTAAVAAWNFIVLMAATDYFEIYWAVDDTGIELSAPAATAFCPAAPSVLLSATRISM